MTVSLETPPLTEAQRRAAEEQFTEIYAAYWDRTRQFITTRLDSDQRHLAEDMTQEAFITLWTSYVIKGRLEDVDHLFGLMATIGRTTINRHYRAKNRKSLERVTDFGNPANTFAITMGHTYVEESPELAQQGRDLDAAMARMTEASQDWRSKDKLRGRLRRSLRNDCHWNGGLTPAKRERLETEAAEAEEAEETALRLFREACQAVAALRVEIEREAGPNWRSSTGMPFSAWNNRRQNTWTSDPTRTHCPRGHLLDRDNSTFQADGTRICALCNAESVRRNFVPKPEAKSRTVSAEQIAEARALLLDPNRKRSIESVARAVGCQSATLRSRIPDLTELRRQVYAAPVPA